MTFGFMGMMTKLLREYKPSHLALVLDVSSDQGTFRSQLYPDYKAQRDPPPEDLRPQVDRCLDLLKQMRVPIYGQEGVEADDVIATIVGRVRRSNPEMLIRIISKDKDLQQLLDEATALIDVHKDELTDPAALEAKSGIAPGQVIDMLTLMGDNADNIPGVPGIGPKTAAQLVAEYGTIEGVFAQIENEAEQPKSKWAIKGKRRENLIASRELMALGRTLITLKHDCEVDFTLDDMVLDPTQMDTPALLDSLRILGFNRVRSEMSELLSQGSAEETASADATELGGLFGDTEEVNTAVPVAGDYTIIRTRESLDALADRLKSAKRFALDTETDGLCAPTVGLAGVSVAIQVDEAYYIPTNSPEPESHLDEATVLEVLQPILADEGIGKIGHNMKFDMNVLRGHGAPVAGVCGDTMVESYVIDATRSSHGMNALAEHELQRRCVSIREVIGHGKKQIVFSTAPLAISGPYAAEDADITLQLENKLRPQVAALGLDTLYEDTELPLVAVLAEMEFNGITVDVDELERQRERLVVRIDELRQAVIEAAPHPFNPDSPKQLAVALFNAADADPPGLGLKPIKKGKTGPSTDVEVLGKLADDPAVETDIPKNILTYRQLTKLVNTYLLALRDAVQEKTGRIHASFNQVVTATGRLSSSNPNLQNIPIRTDEGRAIRKAFVAAPDHLLLAADYSQIELRLLAHLSRDEALTAAFYAGADIHRAVASEVMGVAPEDVTSDMRSQAKMINFGIVYGITPFGLARRLGISNGEAAEIIDNYKARFPRITEFLNDCVEHAEKDGFVATILGRQRKIPQINSRNPMERSLGERMAINTVVQGSAADLIKRAMIDLYRVLPTEAPRTKMLLQIHDELVFEVPNCDIEQVQALVVEKMVNAMTLSVPLVVDAASGVNWFDAK